MSLQEKTSEKVEEIVMGFILKICFSNNNVSFSRIRNR